MELGLHGIRTTIFGKRFYTYLYYLFLHYVYVYFSFTYVFVILFCLRHVILFLYLSFASVFRTMQTSGMERLCEIVSGL